MCHQTVWTRPSTYFSNSQASRDLPIPATPTTDRRCAFPPRRSVEELLDEPQLAVAADERRLEPGRASLAAAVRDHAQARQSWTGSLLPFSSCAPASS